MTIMIKQWHDSGQVRECTGNKDRNLTLSRHAEAVPGGLPIKPIGLDMQEIADNVIG